MSAGRPSGSTFRRRRSAMAWGGCADSSMIRCSSGHPRVWFRRRAPWSWPSRSLIFSRGSAASSRSPSRSIRPRPRAASRSEHPMAFWPWYCRRCSPTCGAPLPSIDISVGSFCPRTEEIRSGAPGSRPSPIWRHARSTSRLFRFDDIPARFVAAGTVRGGVCRRMRAGHPYAKAPTLDRFCGMQHLLVSLTGDPMDLSTKLSPSTAARGGSR